MPVRRSDNTNPSPVRSFDLNLVSFGDGATYRLHTTTLSVCKSSRGDDNSDFLMI